jgi:hypothetical protein
MDKLGLKRYCCRRMVLTHVNLIDKLLAYHTFTKKEEVRGMGGPAGVDSAARGAGGGTVVVNTLDGQTARDFFERAGGRALLNAVRTGRGTPALLFGG